ncbi:MAG: (4Fe-4S)-binding protein, partial [Deltaproteobacteria bacterium]|nr:(4Fe-4S)-binding protein [Deltaproteobacteria bacterium]
NYIVPFLIGSQLARFFRHKEIYHHIIGLLGSEAAGFSLLLLLAYIMVLIGIRLGNRWLGHTEAPLFGRFSPMVPILIPMAFGGELVYRISYLARGIGDFIPTLGRQTGIHFLQTLGFTIPDFPIQIFSAFFMLNSSIAACYILWRFCLEDEDGAIKLHSFIGLNLLISLFLLAYLFVIF